jgi:hypothetical protein
MKFFEPNCIATIKLSLRRTLVRLDFYSAIILLPHFIPNSPFHFVADFVTALLHCQKNISPAIDHSPLTLNVPNVQVSDTTGDE